jgi:hypothetical protein
MSHPKPYLTRGMSDCGPNPHDLRRIGWVCLIKCVSGRVPWVS